MDPIPYVPMIQDVLSTGHNKALG